MAYQFQDEAVAKFKVQDDVSNDTITLPGINGHESDANVIMGGISILFNIVGWSYTSNPVRILNQAVTETND